ncbi:nickel/cobalt transporter [Pseudotabrizicola sp. L79]|uniref:nickel/cobalt transporter n=1 Tax=Pseudotabrizicola sp. L79 TaxID=3118402 RepID=UPI002F943461
MPRSLMLAAFGLVLALGLIWMTQALNPLADWAATQQRAVQDSLAAAVRAIKAGHPGAWGTLLTVCFSYGFFHAIGPGHGKAVIGAYGIAQRVPLRRLAGLALASSLAQSAVAVVLVAGGAALLGWTRPEMEDIAETAMLPLSYALVAGLGLWLLWRGARRLARPGAAPPAHNHTHDHPHPHSATCGCGHAHGPTPAQAAQVHSLRDAALVISAIALRPCSGALFLLVLTFALGIGAAGIAGTFAMGLGTAAITLAVAIGTTTIREGSLAALPAAAIARTLPWVELIAGAIIAALSLHMLSAAL